MLQRLKKKIATNNPLLLFYHKCKAILACIWYRFPSQQLVVVGVTGTKGKTTTTTLIARILEEAGHKVGMTSTVNFKIGNYSWVNTTKQTTLGPFFLQKLLRKMVNEGCTHAVLEVSSHALVQNRVWGVNFDFAVFTNIGEDHLDYHGSLDNYLRAKAILFSHLNGSTRKPGIQKVAVLNKDDVNFAFFDQYLADLKYSYGLKGGNCYVTDLQLLPGGSKFVFHMPNNQVDIQFKMPGDFNVSNALAAATVALALNINVNVIKQALEKVEAVPGRFESIECGQKFGVIVDYAHTAESLEKLLSVYRPLTQGRLILVFGATGGGRDKGKRPKMGEVAHAVADVIVLTDDDPYDENEWEIISDVTFGIPRKSGENFWKVPTRSEAIKLALNIAHPQDTVVVAGKGAEEIQMIHGKAVAWDDRKFIRSLLSQEVQVQL